VADIQAYNLPQFVAFSSEDGAKPFVLINRRHCLQAAGMGGRKGGFELCESILRQHLRYRHDHDPTIIYQSREIQSG
jgi:hypothetical protein